MADQDPMTFGGKDVVVLIEGRQRDARAFISACPALVAQADANGLSAVDLTAAIERLASTMGFDVAHTGTDSNLDQFHRAACWASKPPLMVRRERRVEIIEDPPTRSDRPTRIAPFLFGSGRALGDRRH